MRYFHPVLSPLSSNNINHLQETSTVQLADLDETILHRALEQVTNNWIQAKGYAFSQGSLFPDSLSKE